MRYLFRGLIRETGKTVEGAVEAESPEDALVALSNNGIVTEDLTPAPLPISSIGASARASVAPVSAGRAGPPPLPPGGIDASGDDGIVGGARSVPADNDYVPAVAQAHPGATSSDPIDRAFAAASSAVSFDAVAQRYRGKSVWVIDRDKIRRQVATVVDGAIRSAADEAKASGEHAKADAEAQGDRVRESVAAALKDLFKDTHNIASQQSPEQVQAEQAKQRASQQQAPAATTATAAVSTPQLEAITDRLESFLTKAESTLERLQVAARRVGSGGGGGGGAGFAPRRLSHIPQPRSEEQDSVLSEIFKSNLKLRDNLIKKPTPTTPTDAPAETAPAEPSAEQSS